MFCGQRKGFVGKFSVSSVLGSAAIMGSAGLSWLGTPVSAGAPPSNDVDGQTLEFYSHPAPGPIGSLQLVAGDPAESPRIDGLPFVYNDILDLGNGACLQARISQIEVTDNLDVWDVDDESDVFDFDFDLFEPIDPPIIERDSNPEISLWVFSEDGVNAFAKFRLEFLYDDDCDKTIGTSTPTELTNLCVSIRDIDDRQFAGFSNPSQFTLSAESVLSTDLVDSFLIARETQGESSGSEDEKNWVQVEYDTASSIDFLVGMDTGDEDDASFEVSFGCAKWNGDTVSRTPTATATSSETRFPMDLDWNVYLQGAAEDELPDTM